MCIKEIIFVSSQGNHFNLIWVFFIAVRFGRVPKKEKAKIMEQMQKVNAQSQTSIMGSLLDNENEVLQKIIEAHIKTCEFTKSKLQVFREKAWQNPVFVDCPAHMVCKAEFFNHKEFFPINDVINCLNLFHLDILHINT